MGKLNKIEESMKLNLGLLTEKKNEGDIVEGYFAIAVALYLAYGEVDPAKFEAYRNKIDVTKFNDIVVFNEIMGDERDLIKVLLKIRLKSPLSVAMGFDQSYENDPSLQRKVDSIIKSMMSTKMIKEIDSMKSSILTNGKRDKVIFEVVADGLGGEQAEGNVKGDVKLVIRGMIEGEKLNIPVQEISFSLKSDSSTISNLSPYYGMLDIAESFGIKEIAFPNLNKYSAIDRKNPESRKADANKKKKAAITMFSDLSKGFERVDQGADSDFNEHVFRFLDHHTFGDDLADVVNISKTGIKEIKKADMDALKNSGVLINTVPHKTENGFYIYFMKIPEDGSVPTSADKLFHLRIKISQRVNSKGKDILELKAYVEVGHLAYSKKEDATITAPPEKTQADPRPRKPKKSNKLSWDDKEDWEGERSMKFDSNKRDNPSIQEEIKRVFFKE